MKRNLVFLILIAILATACAGQGQNSTPQASPEPSQTSSARITTDTPVSAEASTGEPTIDSSISPSETSAAVTETVNFTPTVTQPPNAADCTNSATFVADVTVPDNSDVSGGTRFTKTWRIRNTGTCIWGSGYQLSYYSDEQMSAIGPIGLEITQPGQEVDISIDLVAPNSIGRHRANFVIKNPADLIMKVDDDSRLWVIINVPDLASPTPPATATAQLAVTLTPTTGGAITLTATDAVTSGSNPGYASVSCAFKTDADRVKAVIEAINAYRQQNGLPEYKVSDQLTEAAQAHAKDMACNQLFYHNGSNKSTPVTRVAFSGYKAKIVTENVYGSYPPLNGGDAVKWWQNDKTDPNHNKNLLSKDYTEIGVGYAFFDNFGFYVVVFAKPNP